MKKFQINNPTPIIIYQRNAQIIVEMGTPRNERIGREISDEIGPIRKYLDSFAAK